MNIPLDKTYEFTVDKKLQRDYKFASSISTWIKENLESLTDDHDTPLFSKVNLGYPSESLKTFGKHPVCDVHIGTVEYNDDLLNRTPEQVHTILVFYFKGANDNAYLRCAELHDYLIQEFITNTGFRCLPDVVDDTFIVDSELMNQPSNKVWGVMGALELIHTLI